METGGIGEEIAAKAAITEVLYKYCRSMDRIDADLGYQIWHDDGTAHYSRIYEGTGRGFIDWVCEFHRSLVSTSHQITNVLIEIDGDLASSEAYVTVRLRSEDGDGALVDLVGAGRYLDTWSYRDGRWAIDHRLYVSDLSTSHVVPDRPSVAAVRAPGAPPMRSKPDTSDPSYDVFRRGTSADV